MSFDLTRASCVLVGSLALGGWALPACSSAPLGATDANLANAKSQASQGAATFAAQCASCHGQRGEGVGRMPTVMGPGALPEYPRDSSPDPTVVDPEQLRLRALTRPQGAPSRDPFRTAQDVYDFVSRHMPAGKGQAGTLPPNETWAVVHFMLVAHGASVPKSGLTAGNAKSIAVPH